MTRGYGPSQLPRWEDDPYGMAMSHIVSALERAREHDGTMSEEEAMTLNAIKDIIELRDPSSWGNVRRLQKVGPKPK